MQHTKRGAATAAVKFTETAPNTDEGDEQVGGEADSTSTTSSGRRSHRKLTEENDDGWGEHSDGAPAPKKARQSSNNSSKGKRKGGATTQGRGKGRAGKLSAFLAMPLDVLVEVSRHLDPPTLLAMCRVNKMMRNLFTRRSAAPIWATVRNNVDLPRLESIDLSEMQLASLIYERDCHLCGRGRAVIVDYALRRRWCRACQRVNLVTGALASNLQRDLHPKAFECSHFTHRRAGRSRYEPAPNYCLPDVQAVSIRLHELEADVKRHVESMKQSQAEDADGSAAEHPAVSILEAFVADRRTIVANWRKDAYALKTWELTSQVLRREAGKAASSARKTAIKEKLIALGYSEAEWDHVQSSHMSNLVDQPARLTDVIWSRISPKIIEYLERETKIRHAQVRLCELRPRYIALSRRYVELFTAQQGEALPTFPSCEVFSTLPHVEPLWVPEGAEMTDEAWDAALPAILEDVDQARRAVKVGFARRLAGVLAQTRAAVDDVLAKKLEAPAEPVNRTAALLRATSDAHGPGLDFAYSVYGNVAIDLGDTADTVTDAEIEGLFSQLVARFATNGRDGYKHCYFPDVCANDFGHGFTGPVSSSWGPSLTLVKQVLDVLERTSLSNDRSSEAKLEALGPVFECHGCLSSRQPSEYISPTIPARLKSEGLLWSEMIDHALAQHVKTYSATCTTESDWPKIRLSTSTYPPDSTPSPPMVHSIAQEYDFLYPFDLEPKSSEEQ